MISPAVLWAAAVFVVALGLRVLLGFLAIPRRCSSCQQRVRSVGSRFCPIDGSQLRDGSWWLPLVRLGPWIAFLALAAALAMEFVPASKQPLPDSETEPGTSSSRLQEEPPRLDGSRA